MLASCERSPEERTEHQFYLSTDHTHQCHESEISVERRVTQSSEKRSAPLERFVFSSIDPTVFF